MMLWRVAADILPTKDKKSRGSAQALIQCALCVVMLQNLFVSCHMVKVLRFNNDWGFKPNELPLTSASQLVDWVTSPLNHSFGDWKER